MIMIPLILQKRNQENNQSKKTFPQVQKRKLIRENQIQKTITDNPFKMLLFSLGKMIKKEIILLLKIKLIRRGLSKEMYQVKIINIRVKNILDN